MLKSLNIESFGININGEKLNYLRFDDDIILMIDCLDEVQTMLQN